jgi:hypothetical protein
MLALSFHATISLDGSGQFIILSSYLLWIGRRRLALPPNTRESFCARRV